MGKQPRFFDEGDFTLAHEAIHLWTVNQFPKFNAYVKLQSYFRENISKINMLIKQDNSKNLSELKEKLAELIFKQHNLYEKGKWIGDYSEFPEFKKYFVMPHFVLEPVLEGYPPVYPDCIIEIYEVFNNIVSVSDTDGNIEASYEFDREKIVIEIKSHIESFEPIMRQMHIYKSRIRDYNAVFMLIYPEKYSKYDNIFKSQDIEVVHCPDSLLG